MKHLIAFVIGLAVVSSVGCDKGTSTAPSTDPNKPNSERKLTVTSPGDQDVTQDKTDEFTISINRDNFNAPVEIEIRDLPSGVELVTKNLTIPADKGSTTATIKAAAKAEPVTGHIVKVVAKAKDMPEATTTFKLDVKRP